VSGYWDCGTLIGAIHVSKVTAGCPIG